MLQQARQIDEAMERIRRDWTGQPRAGIILGSGLGGLAKQMDTEAEIPYEEIPNFHRPTAQGHQGRLVCGRLNGLPVVALAGRIHCYEGYTAAQVAFPVRVMRALGAEVLIVSSAVGAVNPEYAVGDLVILEDIVNLMFRNPLVGINDDQLGPRFPDMSAPLDEKLIQLAATVAREKRILCRSGVYVAMLGPNYETKAEYRFVRRIGGDVVGMSTVPEVIVAVHSNLRVLGFSVVTNVFRDGAPAATAHDEVVDVATTAGKKLEGVVCGVLEREFS